METTVSGSSVIAQHTSATTTASSQVLGQMFNLRRRRFLYSAFTLATDAAIPVGGSIEIGGAANVLLTGNPIADYIRFAPSATIDYFRVHLIPSDEAPNVCSALYTAFLPSNETSPPDIDGVLEFPLAEASQMGPPAAGGAPPIVRLECDFDYGVQRQIKPTPLLGAPPRFALRSRVAALSESVPGPIIRVLFEVVVSLQSGA